MRAQVANVTQPTGVPAFRRLTPTRSGFTIIEVMLSLFIFAMVLTAVYSTWISILRGTKTGLAAAAEAQRSRVSVRTVEEALSTAQMFNENMRYYSFVADTSGEYAKLEMTSRLPASFLGVGRYGAGDLAVRRVGFSVEAGTDGKNELVMTQAPILMDQDMANPYKLILAKDVTEFTCEFYDLQKRDWVEDWVNTNQLPRLVRVTLGLGQTKKRNQPHDLVTRIIALPSQAIYGAQGPPRR